MQVENCCKIFIKNKLNSLKPYYNHCFFRNFLDQFLINFCYKEFLTAFVLLRLAKKNSTALSFNTEYILCHKHMSGLCLCVDCGLWTPTFTVVFVDQLKLAVHVHLATMKHAIIPMFTSPPASKNVSSRCAS